MKKKQKPVEPPKSARWMQYLEMVGDGLAAAGKPAMITMFGLVCIWTVARVMEALHGNPVLDMTLTNWFGLIVWVLLSVWMTGLAVASAREYKKIDNKKAFWFAWALLGVIVLLLSFSIEGFYNASAGLLALLAGSPETSQQNLFLLVKFHPLNPLLAFNLIIFKLTGISWGIESIAPFVWSWKALFVFFVWSCALGIVLLMRKDNWGAKAFHLSLAVMGVAALIVFKSIHKPTAEILIVFQAAVPMLLLFQVLLFYASARTLVMDGKGKPAAPASPEYSTSGEHQQDGNSTQRTIGLPPAAIRLAVFIVLILPILADLQGRYQLSMASARIVAEVSENQAPASQKMVAVAPISVRSGPAIGDDVLGILPKGTRITVTDEKFNWANIGKNRWIPVKFLRPLTPHKTASS
ncbi:hypothetical protein DSCW_23740 [Desulfosarcina widdelii]|uniref:SH3b domain-containing protein n=1 Tax=Desulfosarcina widdelii TaxID=947919 RepID=A0A5K7ZFS2_9BACT|nr:SH3 domain-containing protein [Desulfosarcina widdelii]BBO74957.1 hypothetical protein DSCW_23740 [Desulfosarcina widdelii]